MPYPVIPDVPGSFLADPTTSTQKVNVKAANTVVTLADDALVTALSPNNTGLPVNIPVIVQKANAVSTGSVASLTATFTNKVVTGNSIVIVCGSGDNGTLSVTDTLSNTYIQAVLKANSTTFQSAIFYAVGITGGTNAVTVADTSSDSIAVQIYEVSGLIAQVMAQPDSSTLNTGTGTTGSTPNLAASSPNSLIFAGVSIGTGVVTAVTAGTGFTNDGGVLQPTTPAGLYQFISESGYLASTSPITPSVTWTTSRAWSMVAAIFKPVVVGVQGTVTIGGYNYTRVTTAATTLVKTGPGILHAVIVNTPTATATIEMDDALTNTTPIIAKMLMPTTAANPFTVVYDIGFSTGLSVTVAIATVDATIVWK